MEQATTGRDLLGQQYLAIPLADEESSWCPVSGVCVLLRTLGVVYTEWYWHLLRSSRSRTACVGWRETVSASSFLVTIHHIMHYIHRSCNSQSMLASLIDVL
jgi:hypothetical protein